MVARHASVLRTGVSSILKTAEIRAAGLEVRTRRPIARNTSKRKVRGRMLECVVCLMHVEVPEVQTQD